MRESAVDCEARTGGLGAAPRGWMREERRRCIRSLLLDLDCGSVPGNVARGCLFGCGWCNELGSDGVDGIASSEHGRICLLRWTVEVDCVIRLLRLA